MPSKSTSFETPLQKIELDELHSKGRIIDIGGGGEGLVSKIGGSRVCAVDIDMNKIREAQIHDLESQWILADGRVLAIKPESFDAATLWFSLGFIRDWSAKEQVVDEIFRVLKPNGLISILGATIDCAEEKFILRGQFSFPDGSVSQMSYGLAGQQNQTIETVNEALRQANFGKLAIEDNCYWFRIEARKP
ncbi:MAG: class I SAM-dependent methyltransferase [Candidatus Thorarchaeota archaeon]